MDVKGAKALSERLAEAARNVDLPQSKAVDSVVTSDSRSEVTDTTAQGHSSRDRRSLIAGSHKFRGLRASI